MNRHKNKKEREKYTTDGQTNKNYHRDFFLWIAYCYACLTVKNMLDVICQNTSKHWKMLRQLLQRMAVVVITTSIKTGLLWIPPIWTIGFLYFVTYLPKLQEECFNLKLLQAIFVQIFQSNEQRQLQCYKYLIECFI